MSNIWQYATLDAGEQLSRIRAGETDIYNQEIARANQVIKDRQAVGLDISEQLAWIEKLDYVRVNKGSLTPEEINYNKKMGITATTAKPNVIQSNIQQSTNSNSNSNSSTINSSNIANLIKSINSNIPIATTSSNTTGNTTNTTNTPNTPKAPNLIQSYAANIVDKYNQELTEFKDNKQNRLDEYEAMLKKELGDKYNNFLDNSASNMLNYDSNIMKMFNANPAYASPKNSLLKQDTTEFGKGSYAPGMKDVIVLSNWDKDHLTATELQGIEQFKKEWHISYLAGDSEGMEKARNSAELIRSKYRMPYEYTDDNGITRVDIKKLEKFNEDDIIEDFQNKHPNVKFNSVETKTVQGKDAWSVILQTGLSIGADVGSIVILVSKALALASATGVTAGISGVAGAALILEAGLATAKSVYDVVILAQQICYAITNGGFTYTSANFVDMGIPFANISITVNVKS